MAANPHNVGSSGVLTDSPMTTVKEVFVRSPYNYDLEAASNAVAVGPGGPSLTVQAMAEDNDLNVLLKRFGVINQFPATTKVPMYGDFSHITDYRSAIDAVDQAYADFMNFPADIRAQFDNDPQKMLEFADNPANIDVVRKWVKPEVPNASGMGNSVSASGQASGSSGAAAAGGGAAAAGVAAAVQSKSG